MKCYMNAIWMQMRYECKMKCDMNANAIWMQNAMQMRYECKMKYDMNEMLYECKCNTNGEMKCKMNGEMHDEIDLQNEWRNDDEVQNEWRNANGDSPMKCNTNGEMKCKMNGEMHDEIDLQNEWRNDDEMQNEWRNATGDSPMKCNMNGEMKCKMNGEMHDEIDAKWMEWWWNAKWMEKCKWLFANEMRNSRAGMWNSRAFTHLTWMHSHIQVTSTYPVYPCPLSMCLSEPACGMIEDFEKRSHNFFLGHSRIPNCSFFDRQRLLRLSLVWLGSITWPFFVSLWSATISESSLLYITSSRNLYKRQWSQNKGLGMYRPWKAWLSRPFGTWAFLQNQVKRQWVARTVPETQRQCVC